MSTHGFARLPGWVLALSVIALPAHAQVARDDTASESKRAPIEITPFASLGSHFSSQIGAAIAFVLFAIIVVLTLLQRWALQERDVPRRRRMVPAGVTAGSSAAAAPGTAAPKDEERGSGR